jgi:hypothetical protein
MNPWVESLGVALLAAGGALMGAWFSRRPRFWWALGYVLPMLLIVVYDLAVHHPALASVAPVSWMMMGRNKFAVIGFIAAMVLTTPLLKLPQRRDRIAVFVLMLTAVAFTSVWPFLAPAFNEQYLRGLATTVDSNGVCRQNTDYTCGPASAVTALRGTLRTDSPANTACSRTWPN